MSGALADGGPRAVGGNQQTRRDRAAVGKCDFHLMCRPSLHGRVGKIFHRTGAQIDAEIACFRLQRADQKAVLDHVGERLARFDLATESEKRGPHRIVEPAVGDRHVEDRLRFAGKRLPNAERFEQPAHRCNNGGSALVVGVAAAERRIGKRDRKARSEGLPQRDRQRQSGKAAAGNKHVDMVFSTGH